MKLKAILLLLLLVVTTACGESAADGGLLPQDSRAVVPPQSEPTATPNVTATPISEQADGYARAFYRAWEGRDFLGMYSLLAPQSQARVDATAFVRHYEEAMTTATVTSIHSQPLASLQENSTAEFQVRVTWETIALGPIVREHTMRLVWEGGRWGVVWDEGLILPELAGGNRLALQPRVPARGNIYDRNGRAMAYQGIAFELGVVPGQIENEPGLLAALSAALGKPAEDIQSLYASALPDWYVAVGQVSEATLQDHILALEPYIGAGLTQPERRPARLYAEQGVAPHVLGYMGAIPAEQVEQYRAEGYTGDEIVGLAGLEAWGERYLTGERGGVLTVVGPSGETIGTLQEKEAKAARSIYTTFDVEFQAAVEQALADAINTHPLAERGALVVLDVSNSAVRAMASYPTYDPTVFDANRSDQAAVLSAVLNDPRQPLVNRAAQGAYPAGSVFKIVTFAAAVNSDLYTPDTRYTSTGTWNRLGDEFIKTDWRAGGHGTVSLRQAIVVSCNSCFYDVGYNLDGTDNTLLPRIARAFGLGQPTGIQGVAESSGNIPDPEWKLATRGEGWVTGDAVNMAIGQGDVQVSPLQIANIFAALANGGTLHQPTLIDHLGTGGGAPEEAWPLHVNGTLPLTAEQLDIIRASLWDVAHSPSGTATHRFGGLPVPVAGKTGTAEAPPGESHAWFAGYAPAAAYTTIDGRQLNGPEIAIAVILENSGEGSDVAAPLFRRIVEHYFGLEPTPFPWQ